uniref:Uncharacterized protein n=1 Tax=viral metagenome TaxID=1070528 RepID=A0A6M3L0A7_9ZZZZ
MQIVEVEWLDICAHHGWDSKAHNRAGVSNCKSTGYLVHNGKNHITIAQSLSDNENVADKLSIPRNCVKAIKRLK